MGRYNGNFRFKNHQDPVEDPETGFIKPGTGEDVWEDGGCCQLEYNIPAKQKIGADGQIIQYTYVLFVPRGFRGEVEVGSEVEVTDELGKVYSFTALGVDNLNRRYTEIWG